MPTANVNGTTLNYRFDGPAHGPLLMFSNSLSSNLRMWDPQIAAVTGAGYRVLRYDSRGMGRSAAPAGPYSIDMLADDAVGLLDHLDIEGARSGGMAADADATIERWFTPAGRARLPADVNHIREMIITTEVEGFAACCGAIKVMDQREDIRSIAVPTMVVVGEDDPGTPVSAAELMHSRIAGSRLLVLAEAAHLANVEQAPRFNDALLRFLATASPV